MKSKLVLKGEAIIELRRDGKVIDKEHVKNLIVNAGKERVAKLLNGESSTEFGYLAIGTGTTSPTAGDTALETEVARASATKGYEANYKATWEKTFSFGSGEEYDITEAGVSDSATESGATLLDRLTFSAKSVDSETELYVKITITVA